MAQLTISLSNQVLKRIKLTRPCYTIGRAANCDVQLQDRTVSSQHARIVVAGEDCFLEDLGSTNKVLINNLPCERHLLHHDDVMLIGIYTLLFQSSTPAPAPNNQSADLKLNTLKIAQLEILSGRKQGQILPLNKDRMTLGQSSNGSAVIIERSAQGHFLLKTVNSKGEQSSTNLEHGYTFKVGELSLRFREVPKTDTLLV
ncbi:FHA domain-containing protein [Thiolinea disciformis]|uniref:FHA domain-containing protein n=1 Tax=Thiolinea disciformis TaxID=125614 RepID=UPI0003759B9B|nr:FHA domain-containing protein [Thiolinea disciformis]